MVVYTLNREEVWCMKSKKVLKKINFGKKNISVKTLQCHCGCQGMLIKAATHGYQGNFM